MFKQYLLLLNSATALDLETRLFLALARSVVSQVQPRGNHLDAPESWSRLSVGQGKFGPRSHIQYIISYIYFRTTNKNTPIPTIEFFNL